MFSKYIYIACGLALSLTLSSCDKYLNFAPENNTYDEVFWVDANNIAKANSGSLSMLRNALRADRSFFIVGDIAGGNLETGGDYWNYKDLSKGNKYRFSYTPYLGNLTNWTRFYSIINQNNLTIEKTPLIPTENFSDGEKEKNKLIAEARFVRAFTNFYMQKVWGDILLVKESYSDPQNIPPLARSPQEETLNFCIADLEFAITHLDNSGSKAKPSKGAAQALLAHIYAWKHDYANAEKLATDVINSGYSLVSIDNYHNIWKGKSPETIFEINMLYNTSGEEHTDDFFNVFLVDPVIKDKENKSTWRIDPYIIDNYFNEDEDRFGKIAQASPSDKNWYLLQKYNNIIYYQPEVNRDYAISNNLVLFRLADIYLLRAEARSKTQKEALALEDLNLIRERAGLKKINTSGDDLFWEIFKERRRELIGEGSTQFDLIRMQLFPKLESEMENEGAYSPARIAAEGYYWPLDMRALLPQNKLLTQNEWWKNN